MNGAVSDSGQVAPPYTDRMIRVYFAEREPEDVPANQCIVGSAGELVLNDVELGTATDPRDLRRKVTTVTASTWRKTFGPASRWLYAAPVASVSADGSEEPELEEGAEVLEEPVARESAVSLEVAR